MRCRDVFGRPGLVSLVLDPDTGAVLLAAPPGECAVLAGPGLDALRQAMSEAATALGRTGWTAWTACA